MSSGTTAEPIKPVAPVTKIRISQSPLFRELRRIRVRDIAEVVGRGLKVPVVSLSPDEAAAHFGWLAPFAGWDMPASSAQTKKQLDWYPTGPGLIADLERMRYS